MTYRIQGLDPAPFRPLFNLSDKALAERSTIRMPVTTRPGFPCRISLEDAAVGRHVLLLNHRHVASGPYAATHAIFVQEGQEQRGLFEDEVPPSLDSRILSLRAFGDDQLMIDVALVQPGQADGAIRRLFDHPAVRYINAHNATRGCFAAKVERA